ncbi:hypothetical protein IT575_14300 [bacterium]|nr:hypothetical protein [bacterium]
MSRYLYLIVVGLLMLALASCGGGNEPVAANGTVSGDVDVVGPFNGAVELNVGLFASGSDTPLQTGVGGRITSAATVSQNGRQFNFSFSDVEPGTYTVRVYGSGPGGNTFYYTSDEFTTSAASPNKTFSNEKCSFTGEGPNFGTISGIAALQGNTTFPDSASFITFIGFSPVSAPQNVSQWVVSSADVQTGNKLVFNVDGIAFGTWLVGLYVYNPATFDFETVGAFDSPVTITPTDDNAQGIVFPADFDGDPGTDPELGVISGTVTFNQDLPAGQFITISANTIPPQQGAPPASFDVVPADLDANKQVQFTLPLLLDGDYSVSIYSYDFATHTAIYFGEYPTTVSIAEGNRNITGIDFDADVNLIN